MKIDFLQEIVYHKLIRSNVVKCFGISQDPKTKNFILVMEYISERNNYSTSNKHGMLRDLISGLGLIHEQGLVHKDFHSGNVLGGKYITDLGLCRPVDEEDKGN